MNTTTTALAHFSDALTHLQYACDEQITRARTLLDPATDTGAFDAMFALEEAVDALHWATHDTAQGLVRTLIADNLDGATSLELKRTDTGCTPVAIRHRTSQALWSRNDDDSIHGADGPTWVHRLQVACAYLKNSVWDEDAPEAVLARSRGDFHEYKTLSRSTVPVSPNRRGIDPA